MKRQKSIKHFNAKRKPSAKGKVGPEIKVGDVYEDERGFQFEVTSIDPEDNLPYSVKFLNLGWPSLSKTTYTHISKCRRDER